MVKGIYHSAAGMIAQQRQLEVIASNLSNADSMGFKEERVSFRQTLDASPRSEFPITNGESYVVTERGPYGIAQQGTLLATENPLDLAIVGNGFFTVETEQGLAYTRDGRFQLNSEGELVTLSGCRVVTEGGTVQIPDGMLKINQDGELILEGEDSRLDRVIDKLKIVVFDDLAALRPSHDGLIVSQREPMEITQYRVEPGYLEESNVNLISQMIEMIQLNKIYEASSNAIKTQDSTLGKAVNEVGKSR